MKTCATCIYWLKLGNSLAPRRIVYDNRVLSIPPGDEGQCRATPPIADNRWPLTMAGDWCGCHGAQPAIPLPENGEATGELPLGDTVTPSDGPLSLATATATEPAPKPSASKSSLAGLFQSFRKKD